MYHAPSVSYPVGRSRFAAILLSMGWLLGAVATSLWWAQAQAPGWRAPLAGAILAAAGLAAGWNWWRGPPGMLSWDGQGWTWPPGARTAAGGRLEVGLDLQSRLLVRWTDGPASHWLWLERVRQPGRWDDLRRAVYSRARPQALPAAAAPSATP